MLHKSLWEGGGRRKKNADNCRMVLQQISEKRGGEKKAFTSGQKLEFPKKAKEVANPSRGKKQLGMGDGRIRKGGGE